MSAIEKIRSWIKTYPGIQKASALNIDYYSPTPDNSSLAPAGLIEVSRKEDILGNIVVENQYNFNLDFVFPKAPGDDVGAADNANWLLDFQEWVQQQSNRRKVPTFGDDPQTETIKAQNGTNAYADIDGVGIYTVHLAVNFIKKYEE